MIVYVTKKTNGVNNYLLNWQSKDSGYMFGQWFTDMKELRAYISKWYATVIFTN